MYCCRGSDVGEVGCRLFVVIRCGEGGCRW